MVRIATLVLILLMAVTAPAAAKLEPTPPAARSPVPELPMRGLDGKPMRLEDFRGKVVVLNVWATWCLPCREEMPTLERLQQAFADRPVVVLALSVDRGDDEKVVAFLDEIGVKSLTVARDPKMRTVRILGIPGLPATLVIDREGREVLRRFGLYEWDGEDVKALMEALLAEPPAS